MELLIFLPLSIGAFLAGRYFKKSSKIEISKDPLIIDLNIKETLLKNKEIELMAREKAMELQFQEAIKMREAAQQELLMANIMFSKISVAPVDILDLVN